jgi:hypothetical protein
MFKVLFCLIVFVFAGFSEDEPKFPKLDTVVKEAEVSEGFIKTHLKDNKLYLELVAEELEKEFFSFTSISKGTVADTLPNWILDEKVLYFKKIGKSLALFEKNVHFRAEDGTPEHKAVKEAYLDSLLQMFPILAAGEEEKSYLIDFTRFSFTGALPLLGYWNKRLIHGSDPTKAFFTKVKSFPNNLDVESHLVLYGGANIRLYFSFVKKPESEYKSRAADERIGFFTLDVKDFSHNKDNNVKRYILRWNLEKADPKAKSSVVKKPIIFHLSPTIPYKYRSYVREGVLEWNKAFEKIGYIGAVEARLPVEGKEFDPSDVRYSTINWAASDEGYAIGPCRSNPWTGEILDSDIIISDEMAESASFFTDLLQTSDTKETPKEEKKHKGSCCYAFHKKRQNTAMFALQAILEKAEETGDESGEKKEELRTKFIGEYIRDTVVHEVGHALGLRHNFKGSSLISNKNLNDPSWTNKNEISVSVMDYVDYNVAEDPKKQGAWFMHGIGKYDYLAIEYGYKVFSEDDDEDKELKKIASTLREKGLDYGTDEDSWLGHDPHCVAFDLGDDLIKTAVDRIGVINRIFGSMEKSHLSTGKPYFFLRRLAESAIVQYQNKVMDAIRYVGGVHSYRDRVGDPSGKLAFEPVELKKQMRVFEFLDNYVFKENVLKIPESLLHKTRINPWKWKENDVWKPGPYLNYVRYAVIRELTDSKLIDRIAEYHEKLTKDHMSLVELFKNLDQLVFKEFNSNDALPKQLNEGRMKLHKFLLERYVELALNRVRVNRKASLLARFGVRKLKKNLRKLISKTSNKNESFDDVIVSEHVRDLMQSINEYEKALMIR